MRVVITGAGGQVGRELHEWCSSSGDDVLALDHGSLDVADRDAVLQAVVPARPDAVIHTAAWTAVDACESDPERAFSVNAIGTRNVVEAAGRVGAHVVYVSTDYVFDGTKAAPYNEWDEPNPQSVYGQSKRAGELEVAGTEATTVRISWVCGRHGNNMVKTILRLAAEHDTLRFVDDQRGRPTIVSDVVPLLRRFAVDRRPGVFHTPNQGPVSWYEFAGAVLDAAGLDRGRVQPIATADLHPPRPAPRPANSVLDDLALRNSGLPTLPDFRDTLPALVAAISG